ncbi:MULTISPECIES: NADH-quinone oxidoreductase subunit NuoK [unclassified Colwellia]|jgi:NADH-quinone oxidoreductase subunit K|uniref:NADH-quinone oxidoreductase subunit NuoK n=1 Tax=unclassified Colwellia TaxID=196834 RepID=UPI0015F70A90|nr:MULTISPECIES: NADH-quinone oxidoreductase subunit NuoK [unclassified Colwellia]MBA6224460.1 NADH-quinone oxidoreductase subunit NuoK [Colwellia sp. MB3u-45]MBA6267670.1 NADH-quinone oxidoreductase subunit NuoK [Colwellia sp. MB3u-43]MBA6288612.1 NADH-quinone oxidoreductase subunit NuoK [Colwellia sp. MB3u-4]MBA6294940.1 NADH-quinone oxidoreductase subunit NuoK [Colwellia sp. MB02u-9]MBA6322154.1 NADH-quinone oxidoreductase subunit NuoK [Colwellia sp. MB02u-19]
MTTIPLFHVLILSSLLFAIGFVGVVARKNTLFMLMSLEIMLNAVGVAFIGAGSVWQQADGQVMFILILTLAAAEVAVGLALLIRMQKKYHSLDIDLLNQMKG